MPRPFVTAALALLLTTPLHSQKNDERFPDPANLMGERVAAQDPADTLAINHGAPALQQLLLKLRTRASMMMIVAHPDDEDGGFLTYESRGQGARVAMLTLTRGEGGQNLMSADFDDALGLLRTQELLAADRYMGVDQFFGTEVDFGFSKTKEESFAQWTHERVLYDAVRAVRLYRPLVLASVFVGGPTDGHGHHQVSGEICQEVFLAAADPKVFPEMGLPPWAPLKVYARIPFARISPEGMFDYATGKTIPTRFHNYITGLDTTTEPTATVIIHEGETSIAPAMQGESYNQWAHRGLALQKTQVGNVIRLAPAGAYDSGYTLMASRLTCEPSGCPAPSAPSKLWAFAPGSSASKQPAEQSIFDGIDTSLAAIASLAPALPGSFQRVLAVNLAGIDQNVAEAQTRFDPAHLEVAAEPLRTALTSLDGLLKEMETSGTWNLPADQHFNLLHELHIKRVQLNNALALALNLSIHARPYDQTAAQVLRNSDVTDGETIKVDPRFSESPRFGPNLRSNALLQRPGLFTGTISTLNRSVAETLSSNPPLTRPYFFRDSIQQPFYSMTNPILRNAPATPATFIERLTLQDGSTEIELEGVVTQPNPSTAPQAVAVVPSLTVQVEPSIAIEPIRAEVPLHVAVTLRATVPQASGMVHLTLPHDWKCLPPQAEFALDTASPEKRFLFTLIPDGKLTPNRPYTITAVASSGGRDYTESFRPAGYPGLTITNYYTPATYKVAAVDVTTAPGLRVAYLPGTGDTVPAFLSNLGLTPGVLSVRDLTPVVLARYDVVVLGVRAYAAHPELQGAGSKPLRDFAAQGGIVIAQYNSAGFDPASAPYPFTLPGDSAHNVVEEAQPVHLLDANDPLLTWPNRITAADFDGWVAERGHGFAATWAPEYKALLETHDQDQDPQRGGLLVAKVGKGAYIYCALALYRQLPEAVPGAYRLLANLLSYVKNPDR